MVDVWREPGWRRGLRQIERLTCCPAEEEVHSASGLRLREQFLEVRAVAEGVEVSVAVQAKSVVVAGGDGLLKARHGAIGLGVCLLGRVRGRVNGANDCGFGRTLAIT